MGGVSNAPAIELCALSKRFHPTTTWVDILRGRFSRPPVIALQDVNLQVAQGELLGLAGPNGAGKSTLLRLVAGLLLPETGEVRVLGQVPCQPTVGYTVSGDRSHLWRLSGRENLRFFAALHGLRGTERQRRIDTVLGIVELDAAVAERPVREYSTGMRQRLSLARGLLGDPRVILLDEPTRGLDPAGAERFGAFIRDELVIQRGLTVLLATHSSRVMSELCTRVVHLEAGRLRPEASE